MILVPIEPHEFFSAQARWIKFWCNHPPIPDFDEYLRGSKYRQDKKGICYVTDIAATKIRQLNGPHSYTILKALSMLKEAS